MKVTNHGIFKPSGKHIKFYRENLTVVDGVKNLNNFSLSELEIPYELHATTSGFLDANSKDVNVGYGSLGTQVTFIAIKVTYDKVNPNPISVGYPNPYLEYYFDDNADEIRTFENYMMLTTTKEKKFPKIFFNNPNDKFNATIEMLVATNERTFEQTESTIKSNIITLEDIPFTNIYSTTKDGGFLAFENTKNEKLANIKVYKKSLNKNREVYKDEFGNYVTESIIKSMERNGRIISLFTEGSKFNIMCVDEYNANQAMSLINYTSMGNEVTKNSLPDVEAPIVTFNALENIYLNFHPSNDLNDPFDYLVTKQELLVLMGITAIDNKDGEIILTEDNITIMDMTLQTTVDAIQEEGEFTIMVDVKDLAGNMEVYTKEIFALVDLSYNGYYNGYYYNGGGVVDGSIFS